MNDHGRENRFQQPQLVAQWITSLAISVICCAVLFVVFAGYIVDLHESVNLLTIKNEVLAERLQLVQTELKDVKRAPLVQINSTPPVQPSPQVMLPGSDVPAPDAVVAPSEPAKLVDGKEQQGIVVQGAGGEVDGVGDESLDKVFIDKAPEPMPVPSPAAPTATGAAPKKAH